MNESELKMCQRNIGMINSNVRNDERRRIFERVLQACRTGHPLVTLTEVIITNED